MDPLDTARNIGEMRQQGRHLWFEWGEMSRSQHMLVTQAIYHSAYLLLFSFSFADNRMALSPLFSTIPLNSWIDRAWNSSQNRLQDSLLCAILVLWLNWNLKEMEILHIYTYTSHRSNISETQMYNFLWPWLYVGGWGRRNKGKLERN